MKNESEKRLAVAVHAAEILSHDDSIKQVRLFGSTAHGGANPRSDIDLVLVVNECSTYDEQELYKRRFVDKLKDSDDGLSIGDGRMQLYIGIATVYDIAHPREALDVVLMMAMASGIQLYKAD